MKVLKAIDAVLFFIVCNLAKIICQLWLRGFHFYRVIGAENVPSKGGFIAAANHGSFLDPPALGIGTWRRMFRYMARDTLFNIPVWGWVLKHMGAIPVKRGAVDRNAWSTVIQAVKDGLIVGLFPEGTRTLDGEIQPGKAGTGMLVYKSRCPVIPVYIHGSYRAWKKGTPLPRLFKPLTIVFGRPITFEEEFKKEENKQVYIEITAKVMDEIKKLRDAYPSGPGKAGK